MHIGCSTNRAAARGVVALALLVLPLCGAFAAEETSIVALASELGAYLEWDVLSSTAVIVRQPDRLSVTVGSPWLVVNYRDRYTLEPPVRRDGGVYLSGASVERIKGILESRDSRRWRIGVIMIDPGHGGIDPGTLNTHGSGSRAVTVREKEIVLATALHLAAILKSELPGKRILLTRAEDTTVSLEARTEMANAVELGRNEAMIYVSIHANGGFNAKAKGFEVWVYPSEERRTVLDQASLASDLRDIWPILNSMREDEFNVQSVTLAESILGELEAEVGAQTENRGLKKESWAVVREALMPAALIELGFVSNPDEAKLLLSPAYQERLAAGIGRGIGSFVRKFEAAMSFLD